MLKRFGSALGAKVRQLNLDRAFFKVDPAFPHHGGDIVAKSLKIHGVKQVFTLCGGHISPILTGCENEGIKVVDTRHEASSAFAADASARLSGVPGVCVVTAGPGVTNTITAVKNAQMAETPLIVIGGAAPTISKGRGALQDIDQVSVFETLCKDRVRVTRVRHIQEVVAQAFQTALSGVPGPVFIEIPIDVLYPYDTVRSMAGIRNEVRGISQRLINSILSIAVNAVFAGAKFDSSDGPLPVAIIPPRYSRVKTISKLLAMSKRPVIVLGSQATAPGGKLQTERLARAVRDLNIPAFLGGMTRGLLGDKDPLFFRQARKAALKEADLIILAGAICDFRLDYGRVLNSKAQVIAINRGEGQLDLNHRTFWKGLQIQADVVTTLSHQLMVDQKTREEWMKHLTEREQEKETEMLREGEEQLNSGVNPVLLFEVLDSLLSEKSILIGDGGDFVGTASRILRPRAPLTWLDPGAYGTLGVGGGFALGAKAAKPGSEVWVLWGDGSCTYSLAEVEPSVRNQLPFIALVGNNGSWGQIARDQAGILGRDTACMLDRSTPYHRIAEQYGAVGLEIGPDSQREDMEVVLREAQAENAAGKTVVVNVILGDSQFRAGSISV